MEEFFSNLFFNLFFRVPAILMALTVHEVAHGWAAKRLGDDTAERMGRLTLNPLRHLDFIGALMLLFGPFGWAKPVPVNPARLRHPKRDMIWVAIAGPLSNILFGYVAALLMLHVFAGNVSPVINEFFMALVVINIGLSFFNLLPIPPLDGSNIVRGFMSAQTEMRFMHAMRFVPFIFLVLITLEWFMKVPAISFILDPLWKPYLNFLLTVYGLSH